jgi:hypothetical protein
MINNGTKCCLSSAQAVLTTPILLVSGVQKRETGYQVPRDDFMEQLPGRFRATWIAVFLFN